MTTQRQYDEAILEAAKAIPTIAQALVDANTLKCVIALYNSGDVSDAQMDQVIYAILARASEEPAQKVEAPKTRFYDDYRHRKAEG
jgi:hypothetical protein